MGRKKKLTVTAFACAFALVFAVAGCAPEPVAPAEDGEAEAAADGVAAMPLSWSTQSSCEVCHAEEHASFADSSSLALIHLGETPDCTDCHEDVAALEQAHAELTIADVDGASRLKKTSVENCESCHDRAELAQITASSTVLTDEAGTVVNQHSLPQVDGHSSFGAACVECHPMHDSGIEPEKDAKAFCASCHHAGVYECGTCH